MTAPQWFSGPPPARGWWPASIRGNFSDVYRWWDGENWSRPAFAEYDAASSAGFAQLKSQNSYLIKWRHWSLSIDGTDGKGAHE